MSDKQLQLNEYRAELSGLKQTLDHIRRSL